MGIQSEVVGHEPGRGLWKREAAGVMRLMTGSGTDQGVCSALGDGVVNSVIGDRRVGRCVSRMARGGCG